MRHLLRSLPALAHPMPALDPADAPIDPMTLFRAWLVAAVEAGVDEPHAMMLCTVDNDGVPDVRVLGLKEVDDNGWWFTSLAASAKGRQLASNPKVALGFHWREQGRQVRVRGRALAADPATSQADFLARPDSSRIATLTGRQSDVLGDTAELDRARAAARARLAADPDLIAEGHTVYAVEPRTVEFWQGDRQRRHVRLRYRRVVDSWARELLWP